MRARSALRVSRLVTMAAALPLGLVACTQQLPPPEPPAAEISAELRARAVAAEAPEGEGVVVMDVTAGAATVTELGREVDGAGRREVCTTPCVTTLSLGRHTLQMRAGDRTDTVEVLAEPSPRAHLREMSWDTGDHAEYMTLGVTGVLVGGLSLLLIEPLGAMGDNLGAADVALISGASLGAAAFVAGIVGFVLLVTDPRQVREGVSREWRISFD